MALTDPQSVTINSTAISLPRRITNDGVGTFKNDDSKTGLKVSSNLTKNRSRRSVRLDYAKVVTDPLVSTTNVVASVSVFFNIDAPASGLTQAELTDVSNALIVWLSAGTNANLKKVLAGEN